MLLFQTPDDRRFDGGGRRLDVLPHVFECREHSFALDTELFGELVDSDLGHCFLLVRAWCRRADR
jgi:hypothetical protein